MKIPLDHFDIMCRTIYGEARGESELGQIAVGWVIINRARDPGWWGHDVETVCLAPAQFSCWNDNAIVLSGANYGAIEFTRCVRSCAHVLMADAPDPTRGATHYHRRDVMPAWATGRTSIPIGNHLFYRIGKGR